MTAHINNCLTKSRGQLVLKAIISTIISLSVTNCSIKGDNLMLSYITQRQINKIYVALNYKWLINEVLAAIINPVLVTLMSMKY